MSWRQKLTYTLLGPYWPEYLVARQLRKKGWQVYRHFYCYNPKNNEYAEIDLLAVAHDGFILVEVKSYAGEWQSQDHLPKPMWQRVGSRRMVKSPVWQIKRARLALIHSILRAYPEMNAKVLNSCRTYVFLDRGTLTNASHPLITKAWANMQVQVLPLSARTQLPTASRPANPTFLDWLNRYRIHFRWRRCYKKLHRQGRLASHLSHLNSLWK